MRLVYPIVKTYVIHSGLSYPEDYMILHLKTFLKNRYIVVILGLNVVLCGKSMNQYSLSHTLLKLPREKIAPVAALNEVFNDNDGTS